MERSVMTQAHSIVLPPSFGTAPLVAHETAICDTIAVIDPYTAIASKEQHELQTLLGLLIGYYY